MIKILRDYPTTESWEDFTLLKTHVCMFLFVFCVVCFFGGGGLFFFAACFSFAFVYSDLSRISSKKKRKKPKTPL